MFKQKQPWIYGLVNEAYVLQERSRFFPESSIVEIVDDCVQSASNRTTSTAIRGLRQRLNQE